MRPYSGSSSTDQRFAVRGCCWAVMRASCEHTETAVAHILYSSSQPGLPLMWWRGKHSKASIDLAMERSSDFAVQQASAYRNGVHNDRIAARFWRADYVMRLCKKEEHPWHCNERILILAKLTLRLAPAISKHPVWRESMPMARCEGCSRCRFAFWRMTSSFPNGSGSMPGSKRLAAIIGPSFRIDVGTLACGEKVSTHAEWQPRREWIRRIPQFEAFSELENWSGATKDHSRC